MKKLYLVVSFLCCLSGCSSWHQNQSKSTNWYKLGFSEGLNGYTRNWRSNYHMINGGTPDNFDEEAYIDGFVDGHEEKCKISGCDITIAKQ
ncbi:MAG: hypothetical protein HWE27_02420 [Gammaproteobacteria bacterium]|nr:hypothetical protein [Gammaproteobacteria bacterium]